MAPVVIETIVISAHVNAKINQLHQLSSVDVEEAVHARHAARWSEAGGSARLLIVGRNRHGREIRIVLYPTREPGVWNLGTAFPVQ